MVTSTSLTPWGWHLLDICWMSPHTPSVWSWSDVPKVRLYDTFLSGLHHPAKMAWLANASCWSKGWQTVVTWSSQPLIEQWLKDPSTFWCHMLCGFPMLNDPPPHQVISLTKYYVILIGVSVYIWESMYKLNEIQNVRGHTHVDSCLLYRHSHPTLMGSPPSAIGSKSYGIE